MNRENFIFNVIFYIILTAFFIYIFLNEKKLAEKIEIKRIKFEDWFIKVFKIKSETTEKYTRKVIKFIESIGTAIILVLIIQKFYIGNFLVPTGSMIPTIVPKDRLFGNMVKYNFVAPEREEIIVFKEPIEDKVLYTKRLMGLPGETVQIKNNKLYVNDAQVSERRYSNLGEIGSDTWVVPKKGDVVTIIPAGNYLKYYEQNQIDIAKVQEALTTNAGYVSELLPDIKFIINGNETGMILDYLHDEEILKKIMNGETIEVTLDEDYYFALGDNTDGSYDSRMWGFVKESRIKGEALVRFWPLNRIGILN